uniref:Uncharacterized protein n=1 Tax=Zea mays TaxID=4577 RepID=B6U6Q1_MAIZE|nr:hypothetical protein [Zea mays]
MASLKAANATLVFLPMSDHGNYFFPFVKWLLSNLLQCGWPLFTGICIFRISNLVHFVLSKYRTKKFRGNLLP